MEEKPAEPAEPAEKSSGLPSWQRILGYITLGVAAVGAILTSLHLVGRVSYLGPGGLKLPSPEVWFGYQDSPVILLMLAAEQFSGILGAWVAYLTLAAALFTLGMARIGNPDQRTSLQELIESAALVLFGLFLTLLSGVSLVSSADQKMMIVGIPMSLVLLPALAFGIVALVSGARRLLNATNDLPDNQAREHTQRGQQTAAAKSTDSRKTKAERWHKTPRQPKSSRLPRSLRASSGSSTTIATGTSRPTRTENPATAAPDSSRCGAAASQTPPKTQATPSPPSPPALKGVKIKAVSPDGGKTGKKGGRK